MEQPTHLPWTQRICFGVGHCLNDLAASMWFSYLIVYLQLILGFSSTYAGFILLIGQVSNAIATPLLGYEVSSIEGSHCCRKYGKRKFLHLVGTILLLVSFPFIFSANACVGCEYAGQFAISVLLVPLVVIFQVGWAAVQVSHLSLIPTMTPHQSERDLLNVLRYAFNIASDISTYVIVWCVFDLTRTPFGDRHTITREYANKFTIIIVIIVIIGTFFSAVFHIGVRENHIDPPLSSEESSLEESRNNQTEKPNSFLIFHTVSWNNWLKDFNFYKVGLLYMFVRLFQSMSLVFMPLYLQESLQADDDFIAKIPLIMNVSGFVISWFLPKLFKVFTRKGTFLMGAAVGVGSCIWIAFGHGQAFCYGGGMYGAGVMMGAASSTLVISGLSFIHDLIGTSSESGAFVYGCMAFCDKLANGIAGMIVQKLHSVLCVDCAWYYKYVLSYYVGSTAIIASLILIFCIPKNLSQRKSMNNGTKIYQTDGISTYDSLPEPGEVQPLLGKQNGASKSNGVG